MRSQSWRSSKTRWSRRSPQTATHQPVTADAATAAKKGTRFGAHSRSTVTTTSRRRSAKRTALPQQLRASRVPHLHPPQLQQPQLMNKRVASMPKVSWTFGDGLLGAEALTGKWRIQCRTTDKDTIRSNTNIYKMHIPQCNYSTRK